MKQKSNFRTSNQQVCKGLWTISDVERKQPFYLVDTPNKKTI